MHIITIAFFSLKEELSLQIHVVQQGETLFSIARLYSTSIISITEANELDTPNLVIGQALVIPIIGQYYFVQQNDTLFTIARRFQLSVEDLARINQLHLHDMLPVGLRIYIPPQAKSRIETFGYIEPIGGTVSPILENAATKNSPLLTYLAPFSYQANRDGTLKAPPIESFQQIAKESNTKLAFVVSNLEDGQFSSELVHILLTVQAVQNKLIDEIINTASREGFQDVHFDFEYIPATDREAYNTFLQKVKMRLEQNQLTLSSALAPKTSGTQKGILYEAHDYELQGQVNDFVVLMTYEWGYSAGPPLPVSPINEVEKVLQYALSVMPKEKIMMGQNLYGYDWTLPFVQGESFARALSPQQAVRLAIEKKVPIQYDMRAQAPFFNYTDENNQAHIVWFEDARSIQAKFQMIKRLDLRGIAYWKLGLSFPQNWLLLHDQFTMIK